MPGGEIWLTEHGPQGGDELNLLVEGSNYGWPFVTYGTEYGTFTWPLNREQGRHSGFEPPAFAWIPSIGVTSVMSVQKSLFSLWRGDLLIGSLRARTLFRIRTEKQRVVYAESVMSTGHAIRDLVEGLDGRIALLFNDGSIGLLEPVLHADKPVGTTNDHRLDTFVFAQCEGCHAIGDGTAHAIGPDLRGIVGRRIASSSGYAYSAALQKLSGQWTLERLDQFLADPVTYAPGTSMKTGSVPDEEVRKKLIEYLATQK
jgi:cytochrome c2